MTGHGAVTIGSLNLHGGMSGAGRPFSVAQAIGALPADIVALQETWWQPDAADDLEKAATERGAELIRVPMCEEISLADLAIAPRPEKGRWGIAVLSRLPVTGCETVNLGRAPGDPISRLALVCSVTTPDGWPLRLICTHLTHKLTSPAQLVRLARRLAAAPPVPTVIAGDLNMPRPATWTAAVAAGYAPTVRGRTYPARRPLVQLDHLLAGAGVDCQAAEVRPPVGSDHLPVLGRFGRRG